MSEYIVALRNENDGIFRIESKDKNKAELWEHSAYDTFRSNKELYNIKEILYITHFMDRNGKIHTLDVLVKNADEKYPNVLEFNTEKEGQYFISNNIHDLMDFLQMRPVTGGKKKSTKKKSDKRRTKKKSSKRRSKRRSKKKPR